MAIGRVAVLGAGVMGSGIAAQVANAGVPVVLLDRPIEGAGGRSALAEGAVQRMLRADPSPFMHRRAARLVTTGNFDDDLELIGEADWIIEAVLEDLEVKRALYARIDPLRKPRSMVSSNTSTIPLAQLVEGSTPAFARDFLITHFFNPPRWMRLLEIVEGPHTAHEAVRAVWDFCDRALGKGVVPCKDTPGFIGNRIGVYWMQAALLEAFAMGLGVEEADAVMGHPLGIPRTGVFGLADLVGIDLVPHVVASFRATLAEGDPMLEYAQIPERVEKMIAAGYTGRKGKGGFYRLERTAGKREKQALDLGTGAYRPVASVDLGCLVAAGEGGARALLDFDDRGGRYARRVMTRTLAYAASLVPEIAEDPADVDEAMRLGYNWRYGPFELIDRLGTEWLAAALRADGRAVPALLDSAAGQGFYRVHEGRRQVLEPAGGYVDLRRAPGVVLLGDVKLAAERVHGNAAASLWDIGESVLCLEFHTKMNALEAVVLDVMEHAIAIVPGRWRGLVIHNEASNFSVGANLGQVLFAANMAAFEQIEANVARGQRTLDALKYAPFPVVGAPSGMALGGGLEVLLHCDAVQAHAESYLGLVEPGVGLVPGWGGCKEMLARWSSAPGRPGGPMPPVTRVFETVSVATVAKSAEEARDYLFLRPGDGITMNRDRVLADARARVLALSEDYRPPERVRFQLPGRSGRAALELAVRAFRLQGKASAYDEVVAGALARVLSGGDADLLDERDEEALLRLEREAFMSLVVREQTLARMQHMLETGKPLRN